MKAYSIRLTDEMMDILQEQAEEWDITVSELIRGLLRNAISDNIR